MFGFVKGALIENFESLRFGNDEVQKPMYLWLMAQPKGLFVQPKGFFADEMMKAQHCEL